MLRLAKVLLLKLILFMPCSGFKTSMQVTTANPGCDGYWDSSIGVWRCQYWSESGSGRRRVDPPTASVSPTSNKQPSNVPEASTKQKTEGNAAQAPAPEGGNRLPASDSGESSPKANAKPIDRGDGSGSQNEIVHPPDNSLASEPTSPQASDNSEKNVDQAGREFGKSGEQQSAKYSSGQKNGGKEVSREKIAGHEDRQVAQLSPQGGRSEAGQSGTVGVTADVLDAQEPTENNTRGGNSAWHNRRATIIAALCIVSY
ncbi:uncharacterized protein TEOVI_000735500 [Trypanosoma equiperdum]|uniref:Expression site-associated gene 9 (ESAG9) protein n=1 Tax=Trypanosoma equiperdum TaxID=5694 RepID=A0A1G4I428_TRYEQ|nr:hypothetical protein TEOVI_000735500 [Trypanosoma equiperdum]